MKVFYAIISTMMIVLMICIKIISTMIFIVLIKISTITDTNKPWYLQGLGSLGIAQKRF